MTNPSLPSTFSISEFFRYGWEMFKAHWKYLLKVGIVMIIVTVIPSMAISYVSEEISAGLGVLLSLINVLWSLLINMALVVIMIQLVKGKETPLNEQLIESQLPRVKDYFLTNIFYSLRIFLGLILLIIPGLIWMARYAFSLYAVLEYQLSPSEALKRSAQLTEGMIGKVWMFWLAMTGVILAGAFLFGIGLLVAIPVAYLAQFGLYKFLDKQHPLEKTA